jgi:hypothetical protein
MTGFLGWGQNAPQARGMGMNQLHSQQQQQYNPQAQQSGNGFWQGLGTLGGGLGAIGAATGATPFGIPLAAVGAGLGAFSKLFGGYAEGGSVGEEQHYDEGGNVQPMQGLGSFSPQNDYASNGMSNQQPSFSPTQTSSFPDPSQMNHGFSGMTPMYGTSQMANQQNQQFAKGGVATNFGRARGRY